jgi:hypothetical protein
LPISMVLEWAAVLANATTTAMRAFAYIYAPTRPS